MMNDRYNARVRRTPLSLGAAAVLAALCVLATVASAWGEPRQLRFGPPSSEVDFRAYKLGLLPADGAFASFSGQLSYDPEDHARCEVELHVNAASVTSDDPTTRAMVPGPDFLDVARFPSLAYTGTCNASGLDGTLDMHGVTHPFALTVTWTHDGVVAEGRLVRADWGMTALPALGGRTIRIRVSIPLPGGHSTAHN
jgi:polyisoprenoid-binding protein YceI